MFGIAVTGFTVAAAWLSGCNRGLNAIDLKTERLVAERSEALGGGAIAPGSRREPPVDRARADADEQPASRNPAVSELTYTPADEARDVAARLATYSAAELSPDALPVDLPAALKTAQQAGREYLGAEEDYILAAIRLLIERHLWSPRFFNDTTVGLSGAGDNGDFQHALSIVNQLRATQRLPYGGEVEARWLVQATDQLRDVSTGGYRQSSELALDATIPLLRGAGLVARESLIQAERELVYAARAFEDFRRGYLVELTRDYFDLLQAQAEIRNSEKQLDRLRLTERAETARFEAGRVAEFRKNIASNDVLNAQANLAELRDRYVLQVERFKIRLGIDPTRPVAILPLTTELMEPDVTPEEAAALALDYRLDLQTARDRVADARREVATARNGLLPDLDLAAGVSVPTDPDDPTGGLGFDARDLEYSTSLTLGLPLDRGQERLRLRQSIIGLQRQSRSYQQDRDNVVVSARQAVRNIDLARFQLRLAEERVKINQRRVRETELKADEVDTQTRLDADNALLDSENARDRARTNLRNAILDYLLESGQLRVKRDGTFDPLPGMERSVEPVPAGAPGGGAGAGE